MSTDTPQATDDDTAPDAYGAYREVVRQAEENDIPAGPGRAAWVLTEWDRRTPGTTVMMQPMGRYAAGKYRCDRCGEDDHDIPGTGLILPSDGPHAAAGALAAPFCSRCAVQLIRESLA